ncbi:uncharacterized protein LOC130732602 isoform X2 [Lotus japonicus]|uniref:uncharacterized protein LOC130732602 isoform X2 n=1 Tax=Lotus japonicus TaxID=34305 RepID=UPI0025835D3A|nr:uncharacterized protein LOC130732602 isoform X2 [Lotus japonicus]
MDWLAIRRCWRSPANLRVIGLLLLGQLVSFSLALTSLTSSLIAGFGVDAPLTQSLFTYASLALVYGSILLYRHHKPLVSWYWYLLLGFADVQGNYLVNKAFQYSSITSVTLLDCWTIPWAILFTWFFLGTRYSLWQLGGGALCVLGLCLVILSDTWVGGGGGSIPILGDVLVIGGTVFYAISNVGEEFCVKNKDRIEVVSMIGVYGMLVTIVEVSFIELRTLESVKWSADILSGATMFNLSLLTSDLWAVVFKIFLYHHKVDWLYFLSFALVVIGLIIYSTTEKDSTPALSATEDGNVDTEYQILDDEISTTSATGS